MTVPIFVPALNLLAFFKRLFALNYCSFQVFESHQLYVLRRGEHNALPFERGYVRVMPQGLQGQHLPLPFLKQMYVEDRINEIFLYSNGVMRRSARCLALQPAWIPFDRRDRLKTSIRLLHCLFGIVKLFLLLTLKECVGERLSFCRRE